MINNKPYTFDRVVRLVISICVIGIIVFVIEYLKDVLLPFVVALLVAYILNPAVRFFQKILRIKSRAPSVILTLGLVFSVVYFVGQSMVKPVNDEFRQLSTLIEQSKDPAAHEGHGHSLPSVIYDGVAYLTESIGLEKYLSKEFVVSEVDKIFPNMANLVSGGVNLLVSGFIFFIVLLYVVFILIDYEKVSNSWKSLVPQRYRESAIHFWTEVEQGIHTYFRAQALIAFIVGVLFTIGFYIIGFPLPIVLGMFIGFLNLIPYLQVVSFVPITIIAALKSINSDEGFLLIMLSVIIVFAIVQTIQDVFLVPKIMGRATGMNPAFILLSLSIWGSILGILGMIVALPFTTVLVTYYKRLVVNDGEEEAPLVKEEVSQNGNTSPEESPTPPAKEATAQ